MTVPGVYSPSQFDATIRAAAESDDPRVGDARKVEVMAEAIESVYGPLIGFRVSHFAVDAEALAQAALNALRALEGGHD